MLQLIHWRHPSVFVSRHVGCGSHHRVAWVRNTVFGADGRVPGSFCRVAACHVKISQVNSSLTSTRRRIAVSMAHRRHQATLRGGVAELRSIIPWGRVQEVPLLGWYHRVFTHVVVVIIICGCGWRHRGHGMWGQIVIRGSHHSHLCGASLRGRITRAS